MAFIKVTPGQLITGAGDLSDLNQRFKSAVEQLESLESTLNGMWDGQANNTFHSAFNADKNQMYNFYNAINQYVSTLHEIAQRYQQAENTNTDTARTRTY